MRLLDQSAVKELRMTLLTNCSRRLERFWNAAPRLRGANVPAPGRAAPEKPIPPISEATLDAIGRRNEGLRSRFVDMVNKSNELVALRSEFIDAASHVGAILQDSEVANSMLLERNLMLRREEESHAGLKTRYRAMHEELDAHRNEIRVLRGEIAHFNDLVRGRETRIQLLESDLLLERSVSSTLKSEFDDERAAAAAALDDLKSAKAEIERSDALIAMLQGEAVTRNANLSVADFHLKATQNSLIDSQNDARALRDALADSEHKADELDRELGDARFELQDRERRLEANEAAHAALHLEHNKTKLLAQQQSEARNDEIAQLGGEINALRSRAEAGEKSLGETRAELQARTGDLRKSERRAEELEARLAVFEERSQATIRDLALANAKLGEVEGSRTRLANRSQALVRAMKDQKARLETAEQRARLLEERLADDAAQFDKVADRLRATIHDLTEQIDKEKLARVVASGALEAARNRPPQPKGEIDLHTLLAQADRADAVDQQNQKAIQSAPIAPPEPRLPEALPAAIAAPPQEPANRPQPPSPMAKPLIGKRERLSPAAPILPPRLSANGR